MFGQQLSVSTAVQCSATADDGNVALQFLDHFMQTIDLFIYTVYCYSI